jgi:hypothetical protein
MESLIMIMLNAGDEAIEIGIRAGLDIAYAGLKNKVNDTSSPIDDKVLQIFTDAIQSWEPKNE